MNKKEEAQIQAEIKRKIEANLESARQQRIAEIARLKGLSVDELTAQIAEYDPRNGNRQQFRDAMAVLNEKQEEAHLQSTQTSMPQAEYFELSYQRRSLTEQLDAELDAPIKDIAKIRNLRNKLESLPADPDVVTVPAEKVRGIEP